MAVTQRRQEQEPQLFAKPVSARRSAALPCHLDLPSANRNRRAEQRKPYFSTLFVAVLF
jgi:hypothetical protein